MRTKRQSGFTAVEGLVILLIVVVLCGVGYYVWNKNKTKTTTTTTSTIANGKDGSGEGQPATNKTPCTITGGVNGKYLISYSGSTASTYLYGFCAPDGWSLVKNASEHSFSADASALKYSNGADLTVTQKNGGSDGVGAFAVVYDSSGATQSFPASAGYTKVGTVSAPKVTGTEYYKLHNTTESGLGAVPKGTKEYEYYFVKDGKSVQIGYRIFPGDTDNTATVTKIAQTVNID